MGGSITFVLENAARNSRRHPGLIWQGLVSGLAELASGSGALRYIKRVADFLMRSHLKMHRRQGEALHPMWLGRGVLPSISTESLSANDRRPTLIYVSFSLARQRYDKIGEDGLVLGHDPQDDAYMRDGGACLPASRLVGDPLATWGEDPETAVAGVPGSPGR